MDTNLENTKLEAVNLEAKCLTDTNMVDGNLVDGNLEDTDLEDNFMARFHSLGLRMAITAWILNADLMKEYPGFWDRFVNFLHLAEAIWNQPLS